MIKPNLIEVWPMHLDYPLHRQFLHDNRKKFSKVIVAFTNMNTGVDYRDWLSQEMNRDGIITISVRGAAGNEDWRNVAIQEALAYSDAEWVWFTEQDFFPEPNMWNELQETLEMYPIVDVIGVRQDTRLHPCCLFIKRTILNDTSRDFSANPPSHDHFGQIEKDLWNHIPPVFMKIINPKLYRHMNGLSQNMWMMMQGQMPNYEPEKFLQYCKDCLKSDITIQPEIRKHLQDYVSLQ